jgi:hypothetical protein
VRGVVDVDHAGAIRDVERAGRLLRTTGRLFVQNKNQDYLYKTKIKIICTKQKSKKSILDFCKELLGLKWQRRWYTSSDTLNVENIMSPPE